MRIAIVSDIHDNVWSLAAARQGLASADALVCCGDLCSPFIVEPLATAVAGPVYLVFGNNDGDTARITENAARFDGRVALAKEFLEERIGGKRFAVNHYPAIARGIAEAGRHDVVCYGHDHRFHVERRGETLLVNPGTLMGFDPAANRDVPPTYVIYDTESDRAEGFAVARDGGRYGPVEPYDSGP